MCLLVCDRTPKQKSKEEPDREARPGLQAEVDEGDEKVITKSLLLNFILLFSFGWEKRCGQGSGFKSSPTYLWGDWANSLLTLVGAGYHCRSVPAT